MAIALAIASVVLNIGLAWATWRASMPSSCQQPPTVDYSGLGRPSYGPYSVKFTAWHDGPWGESSRAVVGHGQRLDSRADYGVMLALNSTDIDRFECRWTNSGVTIIEPAVPGTSSSLEHFVPADAFLGGR